MGGGTLTITGAAGEADTQTFNGLNVTAGNNKINATSGAGGSMTVNFGAINRTGGLVDFGLPSTGAFTTSNADGALGGWATVNGADYAQVVGGNITAFTAYVNKDNAATWVNGDIVSDQGGAADTPYTGTVTGSVALGGLKYTAANSSTVTVGAGNTLSVDGAIIVAASVVNASQTIQGGSITGGAGGGTLGVVQNSTGTGTFTIASTIVNNGGATGFAKAGTGKVALSGLNTYTGGTTISGGTLAVNTIANGGQASAIGASGSTSSNLVIEGATLQYAGATTASDRGFTLVTSGVVTAGTIDVSTAGTNLTFSGQVTSPDNAGLTKTGAGTLTLSNATNNYSGVTIVSGGTLSVGTLANGGAASGIGASSSASTNMVLQTGGTLQYSGATASSDRGFTLGTGGGGIAVSNAASTLTLSGTAVGTGSLTKTGAGTLVLSGTNSYTGGNTVSAGTLRAGSTQAFGATTGSMTVAAGATLNLAGFNNTVAALSGAGNVTLGAATLTSNGSSSSAGFFTGIISGTGGFTRAGLGTQAMTGCGNTYTGVTTLSGTLSVDCLSDAGIASGIGASSNITGGLVFSGTGQLVYAGSSVSINRGFTLSGLGIINVATGSTTLGFSGPVIGSSLRKDGSGTLVLSGTNTYTGTTQVTGGILRAGATNVFGTAAAAGGMTLDNTTGVTLDLNGFDSTVASLAGGGTTGGNITLGGATLTIRNPGNQTYAGTISGSGNLVKTGAGIQNLSGCNSSYAGSTTINAGTLSVTCLAEGGTNSSIGASTSGPSNLVLNGGTLQYVGAGDSTDRQFTLGTGGGTLDSSGSGAIAFSSAASIALAGTNTARTLTLRGDNTGNNTLAAQVDDNGTGKTGLAKLDAGTWILTNQNSTYTGVTSIGNITTVGGVLGVDKLANGGLASSIGASTNAASNLVIGNSSTLRYTGTGDTTDRLFTLAAGTTAIESSGTGAVVFSNTGAVAYSGSGTRTVSLGGTNTGLNTMGGLITDGAGGVTTLAKNNSGTWALTGNNTFTGNTVVNDGNLMIGNGGTSGNAGAGNVIVANATSTLSFNRSDPFNFTGTLSGLGNIAQVGAGTTVLTSAANTIGGGTTVSAGTLQVNGALTTATIAMNGAGSLSVNGTVQGPGATPSTMTGDAGASTINVNAGGLLRANGDLGDGNDVVNVSGSLNTGAAVLNLGNGNDTLALNDGGVLNGTGVDAGVGTDTLRVNNAVARTLDGASVGSFESLIKQNTGVLTLTGSHSYITGTTISAGTLQLGNGGATGALTGNVQDNGTLTFNRSDTYTFAGAVSGSGGVNQIGGGTTVLTGNSTYAGLTNVQAGSLLVNGDQTGATGLTSVSSGAALGGTGIIGSGVVVANGAAVNPGGTGDAAGTLTINGDLTIGSTSTLNYNFGQANVVGGPFNDLITVGGNLVLDGTLNVTATAGGTFGPGIYRIVSYNGALTNNGLDLGTMPAGSFSVQTSVASQVNLVNSTGLALNFWDGNAGPKNDSAVNGGNGTWRAVGDDNWTDSTGGINGAFANGDFAIFSGAAGTVTVDNSLGVVSASGMQFATGGYLIQGADLALVGPQSTIRVGDGTAGGAAYAAVIGSNLTGNSQLVKTDLGTLVLAGANTYTGGTAVNGGALQISADANLGNGAGALAFDGGTLQNTASFTSSRGVTLNTGGGAFQTDADLTLSGLVSGIGGMVKTGSSTLALTANNTYSGGTTISGGTLQLGNGGASGSIVGNVVNNGLFAFNRSDILAFAGAITGTGAVQQIGGGMTILTANSSYSGGTTIAAGTLQLGNGGASGAITGDIANNGALAFNRSDTYTFSGVISGSGTLNQIGSGTTVLTGDNSYAGATNVQASSLLVNGNQTAAIGLTTVASGAALGGTGIVGGDVIVADGGAISPGSIGNAPGTLTINGDLSLANSSGLNYNFGQANIVGGAFNDLMVVGGDLMLDGALNLTTAPGGNFGPGVYRVISYGGALTNNSVTVSSPDYIVQTSVANQINLVNTTGVLLNFWDGATGPKNDGSVNGGNGTWQAAGGDNWTDSTGVVNAPYSNGAFAIFAGATGTVAVDDSLGGVSAAGMQFAADGYVVQGDDVDLTDPQSTIRVGDGTLAGSAYVATITSNLTGIAQLVKSDLGTLVLTGLNSYSGGTAINGGTLQVGADSNLGSAGSGLSFDGGTLRNTTAFSSSRGVTMNAGGGTFQTDADLALSGVIGGAGGLTKSGGGALILGADNTYAGGTTISTGTLQLGNGGASGSISGDVTNNGTLAFDRSDTFSLAGVISGSGAVNQIGGGTTILTGTNTYSGATNVQAGSLLVSGNQSGATGPTSVSSGAALGGTGTIGGDVVVANGAAINPGGIGNVAGTLTINGDVTLNGGSNLDYNFGQANVVGGPLNDLTSVGGDLVLDGTLNITTTAGGFFGPGIYRVISYAGALTDNGLDVTSPDYSVQTSIANQVNLINTAGLTLNYWDSDAGPKNDGTVNGGDGLWQGSAGNQNWTDSTGTINASYAGNSFSIFAGTPGNVTVDNSLGQVATSGMQFVTDGYLIQGGPISLTGGLASTIRVGDGTTASVGMTTTIAAQLTGNTQLIKSDLGTLRLTGSNSYTGGTAINGGTLEVTADSNLGDAAGDLNFNDGTLHTTASFTSARLLNLAGQGTFLPDAGTTLTLTGTLSGSGSFVKSGAGKMVLASDGSGFVGATSIGGGTLSVNGSLCGDINVLSGGRLQGTGTVCDTTNFDGGTVAPGNSIGTLTVAGDYVGSGGTLEIESQLGGDASPTDRLVVTGNTAGTSIVKVINDGGAGAQTNEGIKIIDIEGASNGTFSLLGDYVFEGQQAVVAGAYAYRLYKNGISSPSDGGWYLRSAFINPDDPEPQPLYAPSVPLYEAYTGVLQSFNELGTLQQRVGNRSWTGAAPSAEGSESSSAAKAIFARIEAAHADLDPETSTTGADYDVDLWKLQAGIDGLLHESEAGQLIGGITAHYGTASSDISSVYGAGSIGVTGYGFGGTLTWYGSGGFYVDAQAEATWYNSDISSATLGTTLTDSNDGFGYGLSIETGQKIALQNNWSVTPQAQLAYSSVSFDDFTDPFGAVVSSGSSDSLIGRLGIAGNYDDEWKNATGKMSRAHVYGIANLYYDFLDGSDVEVSGVRVTSMNQELWGGLGVGGSLNWADDRYSIYGEALARTSLADFADSNVFGAKVGFSVKW
jgi:fibronectin-binding autotransporter adhesin